jgi:nucleoside-diphosphate-sugar epimerase
MRVVVTGASGNVGSELVEALTRADGVSAVTGLCRRTHDWRPAGVDWSWADVATTALEPVFEGAAAVVHLAWLFHPMRRCEVTWQSNVVGSARVFAAAAKVGVPALVHASSVGAYSARVDLRPVTETWPTDSVPQAAYSREKAYVERLLDRHELAFPQQRVVRLRPAFTFRAEAAEQQRRLFLGPLLSRRLLRPGRLPTLPLPRSLRLQAIHTSDVVAAYVAAVTGDARGAFNVAATPVLGPAELGEILNARPRHVPAGALRAAASAAFRARMIPTAPELFDLLMRGPKMSVDRARQELGWQPTTSAEDAVRSLLESPVDVATPPTPPLEQATSGLARSHELATGLGARD